MAARQRRDRAKPDKNALLKIYARCCSIRRFEEKARTSSTDWTDRRLRHLDIGQEAVVVGLHGDRHRQGLGDYDLRDDGHMLATGMDLKGVMAELTGRIGGYSKGKGGSMHMFSRDTKFHGRHGIVRARVPLGRLAFAHKYREDGGINYCYFGDGAVNQAEAHEAFNMASLWKLPIVYVIENNKYGMGTSVERASATTELHKRGEAFGILGVAVNGMNVLEVQKAGEEVVGHALARMVLT